MTKLNNKGFALAETLITTVFVMFIFSVIYTNYMPIMAEYERRETYDDIDGKYAAYWMKKMIEGTSGFSYDVVNFSDPAACNNNFPNYVDACNELVKYLQIQSIYYTDYSLYGRKDSIAGENANLKDYLDYLPNFICKSGGCPSHRVIVEMVRKNNQEVTNPDGVDEMNQVYAYSTIGVD